MKLVLAKKEVDDPSPEGTVLNQNVRVGEEVSEETVIELTVSSGKKKDQSVRVSFSIPANTNGLFHIMLYEGGVAKVVGSSFNPEYAAGSTSLMVEGKDTTDMLAVLVNDNTGKTANIGTYHIDFNAGTASQVSGDITAAFQEVGGLAGAQPQTTQAPATQAPVETQAPATQAPPTETQAPVENPDPNVVE
jgi:hypothetical protein